jgi:hypothetical protein
VKVTDCAAIAAMRIRLGLVAARADALLAEAAR